MCKSSRPSQRRREQLDSLHWAGRAKALGLPPDKVRKQAQLDAEVVARVTARITQGTVNAPRGNGYATAPRSGKSDFFDALRYAAIRATPPKPLTIRRPARYGLMADLLILDDLTFDDLKVTLS
jgi:hypothetical protein